MNSLIIIILVVVAVALIIFYVRKKKTQQVTTKQIIRKSLGLEEEKRANLQRISLAEKKIRNLNREIEAIKESQTSHLKPEKLPPPPLRKQIFSHQEFGVLFSKIVDYDTDGDCVFPVYKNMFGNIDVFRDAPLTDEELVEYNEARKAYYLQVKKHVKDKDIYEKAVKRVLSKDPQIKHLQKDINITQKSLKTFKRYQTYLNDINND